MARAKVNNELTDKKVRKTNPENQKIIDKLHKKEPTIYTAMEFCEKYNKCKTDLEKEQFINNNVVVVNYMPYQIKCKIADNIIDTSMVDENGNFKIDSRVRYFVYIESVFRYWTNIHFKEDNLILEYDLVASAGIIDNVLKLIPERELNEFRTIVQMTYDDKITNEHSGLACLEKVKKVVLPIFDNILEVSKHIDVNELNNFLNSLKK